jgi:hypothetical protein
MVMIDLGDEKKPLGVISVTQVTVVSVDGLVEGSCPDEIAP